MEHLYQWRSAGPTIDTIGVAAALPDGALRGQDSRMTARIDLPTAQPSHVRAAVAAITLLAAGLMIWFAMAATALSPSAGSAAHPMPLPAPPPLERGISPR
jgi:hypothetical protein